MTGLASSSSTPSGSGSPTHEHDDEDPATSVSSDEAENNTQTVEAFAQIRFPDGKYYMKTHTVILGRDQSDEVDGIKRDDEPQRKKAKSVPMCVLSAKGGCMGVDIPDPNKPNDRRYQLSRHAPVSASDSTAGDEVDKDTCPVIPIHEPAHIPDMGPGRRNAISRKHLLIGWNFDEGHWQCQCMGSNGVWCDGQFLAQNASQPLNNGSSLQIGSLQFSFHLPYYSEQENERRGEALSDESLQASNDEEEVDDEDAMSTGEHENGSEEEGEDDEEDESGIEDERMTIARPRQLTSRGRAAQPKVLTSTSVEAKPKRGPGRPPKNGRISQRELAEQRREEKEALKVQGKKSIKIMKQAEPNKGASNLQPNGKRKYTKRKNKEQAVSNAVRRSVESENSESGDVQPEAATTPPKPPKEKKPVKEPKAPRSPSPRYDLATLTEEQKSKPLLGYVTILHDILSQGTPMNLTEIYHAMMRRYPYYTLQTSDGWRSSVRHNLGQNQCFEKAEKDGKGHKWKINPNVPFERERKPRRTSPPRPKQSAQQPHQQLPGYGPRLGYPPQYGYQAPNGQTPSFMYSGPVPHPQSTSQFQFPPRFPPAMVPPAINPLRQNSDSTYMSPYATQNQQPTSPSAQVHSAQQPHQPSSNPYSSLPAMGPPINGIQRPSASPHPLQQQQPHSPSSVPQTIPSPSMQQPLPVRIQMTDGMRSALDRFKNALVGSMSATEPNAANLIDCAIARTLGTEDNFDFPKDHPQLLMMMQTVKNVLGKYQGISGNTANGRGACPSPLSAASAQNGGSPLNIVGIENANTPETSGSIESKHNASLADALDAAKEDVTSSVAADKPASTFSSPQSKSLAATDASAKQLPPTEPSETSIGGRLASPEMTRNRRSSSKRPHESDDEEEEKPKKTGIVLPPAANESGVAENTADTVEGKKDGAGFTLELRSRKKRSP